MNLRYDIITAHLKCGVTGHPQKVMQDMGITYGSSIPQSIADQWWFIDCQGVPDALPEYLTQLCDTD